MENKSFEDLYNKNVSEFVEKKGKFNYLSWAFAVKELKKAYPEATYIQVYNEQNKPYFTDESGCYVKIKLFLSKDDRKDDFYQEFTHPILNNQNKSILKPNSFEVNTSFMRGLTKLIGMCTGIGLSLYSGEDLPEIDKDFEKKEIDSELEKVKKWDSFFEKMIVDIQKRTFNSISQYIDFIDNVYLKSSPKLKENARFQVVFNKFMPKAEAIENKAKQTLNSNLCKSCNKDITDCKCPVDARVLVIA